MSSWLSSLAGKLAAAADSGDETSSLGSMEGSSGPRSAASQSSTKSKQMSGSAPQSPEELAELIAAARAALGTRAADVEAQLLRGGEEGLTDVQLKRWLAARGWDPARAAADLAAHAAWRAKHVPQGRVPEADVARELAQRKVFLQGVDRRGRAVAILDGGAHAPGNDALEVQKFYCYCSDAAIALADPALNPDGRVVFIIDVGRFGLKNFDLAGAKTLFGMMARHYVERLSAVYLHNAGSLLMQLFRLVAPFIDPATRAKIVFLPSDPAAAAEVLARDFDVAMLPPNLGGSSPPRPVEEAWADILARRAAAAKAGAAPSEAGSSACCGGAGADSASPAPTVPLSSSSSSLSSSATGADSADGAVVIGSDGDSVEDDNDAGCGGFHDCRDASDDGGACGAGRKADLLAVEALAEAAAAIRVAA